MSQYVALGRVSLAVREEAMARAKASAIAAGKAAAERTGYRRIVVPPTPSADIPVDIAVADLAAPSADIVDTPVDTRFKIPSLLSDDDGVSPVMIAGGVAIVGVALFLFTRKKK